MSESVRQGCRIVIGYIAAILAMDLGVTAVYLVVIGSQKLPTQVARFVITAALCFWLYRGSTIAKWIIIVLLGSAGMLGLFLALTTASAIAMLLGLSLAAVCLSFAGALLASRSVQAFLAHQRGSSAIEG